MVNDNPNGCPFTLALQVLSHRWTQYELKAWLGLNYPKDGQIFLVTYPKYSEIVFPNRAKCLIESSIDRSSVRLLDARSDGVDLSSISECSIDRARCVRASHDPPA